MNTTQRIPAINNQIVSMFEDAGLSPDAIAGDTGFEVESIKAILLQFSRVYRTLAKGAEKDVKEKGPGKYIGDEELEEMIGVIKDIARFSEMDGVRLKAACRIIDEKEGRLDAIREVAGGSINLIQFNQTLLERRRDKEKVLEMENVA